MISVNGELVGINSQILTPTGGNIGLGFAIPSNMAREVMSPTEGRWTRPARQAGCHGSEREPRSRIQPEAAQYQRSAREHIEPGGAASRAGLKQGDVITAINSEKVSTAAMRCGTGLLERSRDRQSSSRLSTSRKTENVRATLGALEPSRERASRDNGESDAPEFGPTGMSVESLSPQVARELGLSNRKEGVVVRDVDPDGAAASAGIQPAT